MDGDVTYEVTVVCTVRRKLRGRTRGVVSCNVGPWDAIHEVGILDHVRQAIEGAVARLRDVHADQAQIGG